MGEFCMKNLIPPPSGHLVWLIKTYFSDSSRQLILEKGQVLMQQKGHNERLYLVLKGKLRGVVTDKAQNELELFTATKYMFVGVYSFFSQVYASSATVVAEERSKVAYIDMKSVQQMGFEERLCDQFMPVVVTELVHRGIRIQEIAQEKEQALKKLIQSEKLASLGQMASGVAHELNNAIAVLQRGTEWMCKNVLRVVRDESSEEYRFFDFGLKKGRSLSSRQVREKTKRLTQTYRLDEEKAAKLAETGMELNRDNVKALLDKVDIINFYWQTGATFHDMLIASKQAAHVVASVRELGMTQSKRRPGQDVNESIWKALALLSSYTRNIDVDLQLKDLPPITANQGELVQIWTNVIKNACENLQETEIEKPVIHIKTRVEKDHILVEIRDNGSGIPDDILPKIFQPNVTTKKEGLSFGLGLGLTIAESIINNYQGRISVKSKPGKTNFTIRLPIGG
ncbi:cyclic nucleotide-binding domain-containing protein [candidate division KSB1 bacterium]|nr:cyclic nucleotide-binding domain-containing protein [candidate division KSB1 bacterium]